MTVNLQLDKKEVYSVREMSIFYIAVSVALFAFFIIMLLMTSFNIYAILLCCLIYIYAIFSIRLRFFVESQRKKYLLQLLPLTIIGNSVGLLLLGFMINHIITSRLYLPQNMFRDGAVFLFVLLFSLCVLGIVRLFNILHNFRGLHRVTDKGIYFRYGSQSDFIFMKDVKLMVVTGDRVVHVARKLSESLRLIEWADGDKHNSDLSLKIMDLPAYLCIDPDLLVRDLVRRGWVYEVRPGCVLMKKKTSD